jgi:Flp pilus assembly protein TadB
MLAVPLLLGISISRFNGWQLALAGAAASGYLTSATAQTWRRARKRRKYRSALLIYGSVFAALSLILIVWHPALCLALLALIPAAAVTVWLSRPGRPRGVSESLAQVAEALVLVPAAAYLAGPLDESRVALTTLAAGLYLAGTVLAVRSVIRERGNSRFAALSIGYHAVAALVALLLLPGAYAVLFVALAARALALPIAERRLANTAHPLRPAGVGMVEIVASVCLVGLCFARPL